MKRRKAESSSRFAKIPSEEQLFFSCRAWNRESPTSPFKQTKNDFQNKAGISNACPEKIDPLKSKVKKKIQEKMKTALQENENLADMQ